MKHETALEYVFQQPAAKAKTAPDFSGKWKNELESFMEVDVNGSDVSGTYTSIQSGTGKTVSGPIIGYVNGDVIAFSVLWPSDAASITSWVGQIVVDKDGVETLDTLWHLIVNVPNAQDPKSIWTTIHAGADQFNRQQPDPVPVQD